MFMYSVQQSRKVSVTQGRENYPHSDIKGYHVCPSTNMKILHVQASLVAIVVHINVNETVFVVIMFSDRYSP